ncbi:MAG TPA: hypothetical protein VEW70_15660, partial [Burkholderiales bacterium]|nr:hypothetical protein [Burkholderiales bacterium]
LFDRPVFIHVDNHAHLQCCLLVLLPIYLQVAGHLAAQPRKDSIVTDKLLFSRYLSLVFQSQAGVKKYRPPVRWRRLGDRPPTAATIGRARIEQEP